jgi:hypothetical protein
LDDFAVGGKISYADVSIWYLLRDTFTDAAAVSEAEQKANCIRLTKIASKVAELPTLKSWLINRPKTIF